MKNRRWGRARILAVALVCCIVLLPVLVFAGGHGEDEEIAQVISTEGKTGVSLFLINLYNDHRLLYALLVTATMAFLGMVVGQVTEMILRAFGIRGGH